MKKERVFNKYLFIIPNLIIGNNGVYKVLKTYGQKCISKVLCRNFGDMQCNFFSINFKIYCTLIFLVQILNRNEVNVDGFQVPTIIVLTKYFAKIFKDVFIYIGYSVMKTPLQSFVHLLVT